MSAIAWTEFLCGPLRAKESKVAEQLIDSVLRWDVPLATVNPADFRRMETRGLRVVVA
jgi:hypothetical protein